MIDHIVFIKFKKVATEEQKDAMREGLRSMVGEVFVQFFLSQILNLSSSFLHQNRPGVVSVEEGHTLPRSYNRGFEYAIVVKIDSEENLSKYGPHEYHQKISKELVRPIVEDMFGLDIVIDDKKE